MLFWTFIGVVIGATAVALHYLTAGFYSTEEFRFVPIEEKDVVTETYTRKDVYVKVKGTIHGWLYTPKKKLTTGAKFPIVVMGYGIGSQKDQGFQFFSEQMANAGLAAYSFDHRTFGGSPPDKKNDLRNYINPWAHVADYRSIVKAIQQGDFGPDIDPERIILWGTSFGGGHVVVTARQLGTQVKAIVSMMPNLDTKAALKKAMKARGVIGTLRLLVLAVSDMFRSAVGLPPIYIKIAGTASEASFMVLSESDLADYFSKHPAVYMGGWQNRAPARIVPFLSLYNPIRHVEKIQVPILFVGAAVDNICPTELVEKAATMNPRAELFIANTTHFKAYGPGEERMKVAQRQISFIKKHLEL